MLRHSQCSTRRARGFTIIETLVSLVVLSVGLLGVAALQLTSLRSNQTSALRTQATFLAYDIIDRMRANRTAAAGGAYDIAIGAAGTSGTTAGNDLVNWKNNLASTLPNYVDANGHEVRADGSIARNGNVFTVNVVWGDTTDAATGRRDPLQFSVQTQIDNH